MNRKQFILSQGATCANWNWSWSFINKKEKIIIFGAWDTQVKGKKSMIFSDEWILNNKGHKNAAYDQSKEHIRLILEEKYQLRTFKMYYSDELRDKEGIGPAKIDRFDPILEDKILKPEGKEYYACEIHRMNDIAEEVHIPSKELLEGAAYTISVNAYERNPEARQECLDEFGYKCTICCFDFEETYGELGKNYIHVHHLKPLHEIGKTYKVIPTEHLRPVCANCHSMIHRGRKNRSIEEMKNILTKSFCQS